MRSGFRVMAVAEGDKVLVWLAQTALLIVHSLQHIVEMRLTAFATSAVTWGHQVCIF